VALGKEDVTLDPELKAGEYIMLSITDTGTGMSAEVQDHLFEPFFTTKELGRGTGLGLATVYGIVKQSGGAIQVDSAEGEGSTFRIYLPSAEETQEFAAALKAMQGIIRFGGETILLVEDDAKVRDLTRRVLESLGYTLLHAQDGQEAQQVAQAHAGPIHLLLTDVVMPGGNGRTLADRLTEMRPELKVLYMSGYTADAIDRHGVLDPGVAFLPKPFKTSDLLTKVQSVLSA